MSYIQAIVLLFHNYYKKTFFGVSPGAKQTIVMTQSEKISLFDDVKKIFSRVGKKFTRIAN